MLSKKVCLLLLILKFEVVDLIAVVLRLYPPVPIHSRTALGVTTLPAGAGPNDTRPVVVRKDSFIGYTVYIMHRLKKLCGKDANFFRSESWDPNMDDAVDLKNIGYG